MALRRLPVVQAEPSGEDALAARRPPWQWVLIGAGLLVTTWVPLAMVAMTVARWVAPAGVPGAPVAAALVAATFISSATASGFWVGRFGPRAGRVHAALSGALAAVSVWGLAFAARALGPALLATATLVTLVTLGSGSSFIGWRWARRRPRP